MNRSPDMLDEDTADRLLGGLVSPADAPPGYASVAQLLATARGDGAEGVTPPVPVRVRRRSHHVARLAALVAAVGLVIAASASYADVLPVSTSSIRQAVNTMLQQSTPPVGVSATRWQSRYLPGAQAASVAGTCTAARDAAAGTLRVTCPGATSGAVIRYAFAVPGARGVPTFAVETGRSESGLIRTSIGRVKNGRMTLTVRINGKGTIEIHSVSVGFYGRS